MVPDSLHHTIMHMAHGLLGHRGVKATLRYLTRYLYWPNMKIFAQRWIRACVDCSRRKLIANANSGVARTWKLSEQPFMKLSLDTTLAKLPKNDKGYTTIVTVICTFTRFPFAFCLEEKTSEALGEALYTHVFSTFGFPMILHSDNAKWLCSRAMEYLYEKFNVTHTTIITNHPQGNAHIERFHRYFHCTMTLWMESYKRWYITIPMVLMAYRGMVHATTGYTPFYMVFGRDMVLPLNTTWIDTLEEDPREDQELPVDVEKEYVDALIAKMQTVFSTARQAQRATSVANQAATMGKRTIEVYKRGDPVFLE